MFTIFAHSSFLFHPTNKLITYVTGSEGVILFFAISGYLISKGFVQQFDAAVSKKQSLIEFWIKRAFRIMPMAILWLIIPIILVAAIKDTTYLKYDIRGAIAAIFNVYNVFVIFDKGKSMFGVYWSLSLEEQFYLLFPFFLLAFKKWRTRIIFLVLFSLSLNLLGDIRPSFRCEGIIYGVILFLILHKYGNKLLKANTLLKIVSALLLLSLLIIPPALGGILPEYIFYMISPMVSTALVFFAIQQQNIIPSFGKLNAAIDWIGTRSYGIYLIHITAMKIATHFNCQSSVLRLILFAVICFVITEICYQYFELPLRNYGRNISRRILSEKEKSSLASPV